MSIFNYNNKDNKQPFEFMEFFNKYKDLFGVPEGTTIPQQKLSINNSLFIQKPFVPTYTESYNINNKLKALKKDYNDLESQITQIQNAPKRTVSRRSRLNDSNSFVKKEKGTNLSSNINEAKRESFPAKRTSWLHDEQKNIQKHSELDYIFNNKIKEDGPKLRNPHESRLPKAENFMFGVQPNTSPKVNFRKRNADLQQGGNFLDHNPSNAEDKNIRPMRRKKNNEGNIGVENNQSQGVLTKGSNEARQRRMEAKRNLNNRRQKLGYLLRTSW